MGKGTLIFRKEGEGVAQGRVTGSMLEAVSLLEIIWAFELLQCTQFQQRQGLVLKPEFLLTKFLYEVRFHSLFKI